MQHSSPGDPEGRRLAKSRAAKLAEAARLVRCLDVLLKQADFHESATEALARNLAAEEQAALQRAFGRIEPRRRFKHRTGHPNREGRSSSMLHIDECGRSNPEPHVSNAVFALGAVALTADEGVRYVAKADALKRKFFGTTDMTLHEPAMRRREGPYYFQGNSERQHEFDAAIEALLQDTDFVAFGCGIRKDAFARQFEETGADPYLPSDVYSIAVMMVLERYVDFICMTEPRQLGAIVFESQGPREDAYHQLEFARLLLDGTQWVPPSAFQQAIEPGARFVPKRGSDPTELADIVSREVWDWVRSGCTVDPKYWTTVSKKTYCRAEGMMGTFGVKVFPDSDIRDRIEQHREWSRSLRN